MKNGISASGASPDLPVRRGRLIPAIRFCLLAVFVAGIIATLLVKPRVMPSVSESLCIHQPTGGTP